MPTVAVWLFITFYAALYSLLGLLLFHFVIPWYMSPLACAIVLLLAVAVGSRPRIAPTIEERALH